MGIISVGEMGVVVVGLPRYYCTGVPVCRVPDRAMSTWRGLSIDRAESTLSMHRGLPRTTLRRCVLSLTVATSKSAHFAFVVLTSIDAIVVVGDVIVTALDVISVVVLIATHIIVIFVFIIVMLTRLRALLPLRKLLMMWMIYKHSGNIEETSYKVSFL